MRATWLFLGLLAVAAPAAADDASDIAAGEKLYVSQCKLCHGNASASQTGRLAQPLRLAMQRGNATASDVSRGLSDGLDLGARETQLAFAPPFGPNLKGVYGRPAGALTEFQYSSTFMKTLKGMEWNDAALDVWITNTQAWVPGVYMFYKQPDAEIRRKIILYLKANR
jgi:cytochrome c2